MYNEDREGFIETIHCNSGDCLIFAIDMDCYDGEEVGTMLNELRAQMPEIKMGVIPSDLVDYMIHIKNNNTPNFGYVVPGVTTTTNYTTPCVTSNCYTEEELDTGWSKLE